jgi:hypothetical protein
MNRVRVILCSFPAKHKLIKQKCKCDKIRGRKSAIVKKSDEEAEKNLIGRRIDRRSTRLSAGDHSINLRINYLFTKGAYLL